MSNHQEITDLAKALTSNEHLYTVQPFIKITGDTLLGLLLERIVYWSDKSSNSNLKQLKIFYKTAEEWEEELGLSYSQVTRARKTLESMGFIQTSKHKVAGAPTLHYYANIGAIKEAITLFYQSSSVDYANLNNSEIQESPNSNEPRLEIQESELSSYNSTPNSSTTTKEGMNQIGDLCKEHFSDPAIEPYRTQLLETVNRYSAVKVLWAIQTALSPDRQNGRSKSWGYVLGILEKDERRLKNQTLIIPGPGPAQPERKSKAPPIDQDLLERLQAGKE